MFKIVPPKPDPRDALYFVVMLDLGVSDWWKNSSEVLT